MASPTGPTDFAGRVQFVMTERKQVIQQLAMRGSRAKAVLDAQTEPNKTHFQRLEALLSWLDREVEISPELKDKTKIDDGLAVITSENFYFPGEFKTQAAALIQKWQSENWGSSAPAVLPPQQNEDDEQEQAGTSERRGSRTTSSSSSEGVIMKVPYDHPIWGTDGIMHGLALKKMASGRKSKVLNPEYRHLQRNAKVYGHNDITVGRWFPYQLSAVFYGAHGTSQAGISPGPVGAYSVIVSGIYEDLDKDLGDVIHYSGSGSHENTDPGRVAAATSGTRSLHSSIDTGEPVRVLRSHSGMSRFAPFKGLRYDGLYRVASVSTPVNKKGGLYERFKLEREEDHISLDRCKARPNGRDLYDYDRIDQGYIGRR